MTTNRRCRVSAPASRASIWTFAVGFAIASAAVWMAGCDSQPRVMELEPLRVERQWRRSVGSPQLELPAPRIAASEGGVLLTFQPSGTIERSTITREFLVTPIATIRGSAARGENPADLEATATELIRLEYPSLASNAEAAIAPAQVEVGNVVLATGGGRSLADLQFSIEPEEARIEEPRRVGIAAKDVIVIAAKLVSRNDPSVELLEGRLVEGGGEDQRFEFSIAGLGEGDCRRLRALLLGDYSILADCEVRIGANAWMSETRSFEPAVQREWQDPIRRAASQRLQAIADPDPASALTMALLLEGPSAQRGEALPDVLVTNTSNRPVLELRAFSAAFQQRSGASLAYVGSGVGDGESCLCPGESLKIIASDRLDPCGDAIDGEDDGLLAVVSTSGLERRVIGPVPVGAVPRFGATLLPPRAGAEEVLLEASSRSMVPAGVLELRLSFGREEAMRVAFPSIPAGGSGGLRLPADLDAESAAVWARWKEAGGRVDVELLEASLWDCEEAAPAQQAFRIGR